MIAVSSRLNGIGEYYFSTKLREIDELNKAGYAVINLGIGSPDLPPHPPSTVDFDGRSAIERCNAAFTSLPSFRASQF